PWYCWLAPPWCYGLPAWAATICPQEAELMAKVHELNSSRSVLEDEKSKLAAEVARISNDLAAAREELDGAVCDVAERSEATKRVHAKHVALHRVAEPSAFLHEIGGRPARPQATAAASASDWTLASVRRELKLIDEIQAALGHPDGWT